MMVVPQKSDDPIKFIALYKDRYMPKDTEAVKKCYFARILEFNATLAIIASFHHGAQLHGKEIQKTNTRGQGVDW